MPAPLVVGAAAAAAKLLAKKVAKDSAKKISKATVIGIKSGRTTGKTKAILRASDKYGELKIAKGKNSKLLAKDNKKATTAEANKYGVSLGRVPASKTRNLKIGNTRTASPVSKGFSSGTKPVPVKKKSK
jgi:hypothetical protein